MILRGEFKMANISTYINQIQSASRGEEVRDSIVNALLAMNSHLEAGGGGSGGTLDNAALFDVFDTGKIGTADIYDSVPVQNSKRAVESGGLYIVLGNIETILNRINGEVV